MKVEKGLDSCGYTKYARPRCVWNEGFTRTTALGVLSDCWQTLLHGAIGAPRAAEGLLSAVFIACCSASKLLLITSGPWV